ncbi:helix-turn-helix domain-containing protein [Caballeronia sp. BR00000012568055]|uniref:helix-turn-helix domain-containing protein n=1 Tax=Caballeronia sp. BR00000012568055 TaxID=2918761 RepID=UPI0023F693A5|nr:helix-turn-helix domain-containing protein [Caballeronia sp. BR00000012568055]
MSAHPPSSTRDVRGLPSFAQGVSFSAYTSVDEQASAFDGWDAQYTQISGGTFHGSLSTVSLGGVRLLVEGLDKVIFQQGAIASDRLVIAVPLELEGHARLCGEKSGRDSLHVFSSLPRFEFYSPDRHMLVNVEIQDQLLSSSRMRALAESLRARSLAPIIPMASDTADHLRLLLQHALAASALTAENESDRERVLERTVMYAVSEALSNAPDSDSKRTHGRHWNLVNTVNEKLREPSTCPLSIAELCVDLGLSRRTVQYAFHQALNLNPVAYLRAVRLNHARRALRSGQSVTSAATTWGFLHFGSFASDYRRMFGELPSVTARRYASKHD